MTLELREHKLVNLGHLSAQILENSYKERYTNLNFNNESYACDDFEENGNLEQSNFSGSDVHVNRLASCYTI